MNVMGRRAIPASLSHWDATNVVIIENIVKIQLIANMEKVSASAVTGRLILANKVLDPITAVVDAFPGTSILLGTILDTVEKSPGPVFKILNVMIGIDLFVVLSMTKANDEKEYQSCGA